VVQQVEREGRDEIWSCCSWSAAVLPNEKKFNIFGCKGYKQLLGSHLLSFGLPGGTQKSFVSFGRKFSKEQNESHDDSLWLF
jgi:hypothetical protein